MLGMGATLTIKDFKDVLRIPKSVSIGVAIQLLLVPAITILFINTISLQAGVIAGLALIAAVPGGTTSNIFTYMARGNIPLSISITGITTIACLITTPLIMALLASNYLPADFNMPTEQIIKDIALTLLLPLAIGMMILRLAPEMARVVSKWSIRLSLVGILLILVGSSSAGRLDLAAFGTENLLWVVIFISVLTLLSLSFNKLLQLTRVDSTAIEMEVVVRNVNLAVLIKASMFPVVAGANNSLGDTVLFTVLLYGGLQMLVAFALITIRRRQKN